MNNIISSEQIVIPFDNFNKLSKMINEIITEENEIITISIPYNAKCIKKCIDFCDKFISEPFDKTFKISKLPKWTKEFIDFLNPQELFDLMLTANYLEIDQLDDLTCAKIASMIKDKNPEEIRKIFDIQENYHKENVFKFSHQKTFL